LESILEAGNTAHRSLLCHIRHLYNTTSLSLSLNSRHWAETKPTRTLRRLASHIATNFKISPKYRVIGSDTPARPENQYIDIWHLTLYWPSRFSANAINFCLLQAKRMFLGWHVKERMSRRSYFL